MTSDARRVAHRCLVRIDHHGAYANLVVAGELERSTLDERDRRFVTELVYGTTRMRRACDALVDRFVRREPRPEIRTLLRLGAYQLHFAGVEAYAAVDATVRLAPRAERGFVNAVLRRVARAPMRWSGPLGERLSYPDWLVERMTTELGEADAACALERMNLPATTHVRDDGYTQDLASQAVVAAMGVAHDDLVLDACAAPGGKATALAQRGAHVVAVDVRAARAGLVAQNASRTGTTLDVVTADATRLPFADEAFDRVLLDAPCSGLGTLRRRPDARWRVREADITTLAALQHRLLDDAARVVRRGGALFYSVCTVTREESTAHPIPPGFEVDATPPGPTWRALDHGWQLLPDADHDGMTIVHLRRR